MGREAWPATVHAVAKGPTRLKRLSTQHFASLQDMKADTAIRSVGDLASSNRATATADGILRSLRPSIPVPLRAAHLCSLVITSVNNRRRKETQGSRV